MLVVQGPRRIFHNANMENRSPHFERGAIGRLSNELRSPKPVLCVGDIVTRNKQGRIGDGNSNGFVLFWEPKRC